MSNISCLTRIKLKMSPGKIFRLLVTVFSWVCFAAGTVVDLRTMYSGQEFKFFIYLTNWGLILLNVFLALEVLTDWCKMNDILTRTIVFAFILHNKSVNKMWVGWG